jgi:indolepyruvate ferredoxin oxidoreductase alpha subunit
MNNEHIHIKDKLKDKLLLTGNEAIALGAYKAGVGIATGYPGTPSSEILPYLSKFKNVITQWSINEKTALEIAIGASIGYKRSLFTTKHVGLNVASDPFMTLAITGVRGGITIVTADDPDMHSSQNEQDNRFYAKFAKVPMLEPSDSMECFEFAKIAFDISENFDTPVLLRTTTRISHSRSIVNLTSLNYSKNILLTDKNTLDKKQYVKDIEKFVMVPVYARKRHKIAIKRLENLKAFSNNSGVNKIEYNDLNFGIITNGVSYQYVKEVASSASILKLSFSYPLPDILIKEFASKVKNIIIIEELEPFIENEINSLGITIKGKEFFPRFGELTPDIVEDGLIKAGFIKNQRNSIIYRENTNIPYIPITVPPRLPTLCSGCPHTSVFYALKRLKVPVMGDIGCYTIGALPPLNAMDACISMGLAFGAAQGLYLSKSSSKKAAAVMGDSTFFHSGITSLIDAKYNDAHFTAIILDNSTTAMTGGQDHPGTGKNISEYSMTNKIDIQKIVEAMGINKIYIVDTHNFNETYNTLKEALSSDELNVVITKKPCVLYPKKLDMGIKFTILEKCNGCNLCKQIGCPSILISNKITNQNKLIPYIDDSCIGCSICKDICIFGFIEQK